MRDFVEKTGIRSIEIHYNGPYEEVNEPFIVIVPSYDEMITETVRSFVQFGRNEEYLIGFAGSGNLNFDGDYCFNAKDLSTLFQKPLLYTFEFSGTESDVQHFKEELSHYAGAGTK